MERPPQYSLTMFPPQKKTKTKTKTKQKKKKKEKEIKERKGKKRGKKDLQHDIEVSCHVVPC